MIPGGIGVGTSIKNAIPAAAAAYLNNRLQRTVRCAARR